VIVRFLCLAFLLAAAPSQVLAQVPAAKRVMEPGERAFQYCFSCHSVDPAETDLQGPNLFGVVGRPIASLPGYEYSAAMRAFGKANGKWTLALIERFIQEPHKMVPGTVMEGPPGVDDAEVRKLILGYLSKKH
jgi:cytochrome c